MRQKVIGINFLFALTGIQKQEGFQGLEVTIREILLNTLKKIIMMWVTGHEELKGNE